MPFAHSHLLWFHFTPCMTRDHFHFSPCSACPNTWTAVSRQQLHHFKHFCTRTSSALIHFMDKTQTHVRLLDWIQQRIYWPPQKNNNKKKKNDFSEKTVHTFRPVGAKCFNFINFVCQADQIRGQTSKSYSHHQVQSGSALLIMLAVQTTRA